MKDMKLKVVVYDENGVAAYYTLPYDVNGVIWEVFEIKNGELIPLQKTYSNVTGKKWWTKDKTPVPKNLKAHLEYEKILRGIMADPMQFLGTDGIECMGLFYGPESFQDFKSFAYHDLDGDGVDELIFRVFYDTASDFVFVEHDIVYGYKNGHINKILNSHSHCEDVKNYKWNNFDFYMNYISKGIGFPIPREIDWLKISNGKLQLIERNTIPEGMGSEEIKALYSMYNTKYWVKLLDITEANITKYRNTYNSTDFRGTIKDIHSY